MTQASRQTPAPYEAKFVDEAAPRLGISARLRTAREAVDARGPRPDKAAAPRPNRRSREPVGGSTVPAVRALFNAPTVPTTAPAIAKAPASGESVTARSGGPLATGGATFTPPPSSEARRVKSKRQARQKRNETARAAAPTTKRRWDLLAGISRMLRVGLAPEERGPSVCGCGRPGYDIENVGVHKRRETAERPARAFVSGVYRCGSGWLCPTCAPAVAAIRQARVQRVVQATTDHDGTFVMGLVTVSHGPADRLADLKRLVTESFQAARRGAPWDRIRKRGGIAGVLVAPEVTHGDHGWHVHIHFGMSCLADEADARAAGEALVQRFMRAVEARGGRALRHAQGVQVAATPEAAGEYIAKGTSWELAAGSSGHKSHAAGRTPWDVAEDALDGDDDSYRLWREFAETMPGTRSCVVTPRLAAALGIDEDDDEEKAGEFDLAEDVAKIGEVPTPTWKTILRTGLAGTFLDRIEQAPSADPASFAAILATTVAEAEQRARHIADLAEARRRRAEEARAAVADRERAMRRDIAIQQALHRLGGLACGSADTLDRLSRACADVAAVCPDVVPPTPAELLRLVRLAA